MRTLPTSLQRFYPGERPQLVLPIVVGLASAGLAALMLAAFDEKKWLILTLAGLAVLVPAIILKDSQPYWLALFICSLPFEISKNLFKGSVDSQWVFDNLGMPPWGSVALKLYLSDLPFLVLLILWIVRSTTAREPIYLPKRAVIILAFLGWVSAISLFANYPHLSFLELLRQYRYFLIFLYFINNLRSKRQIRVLIISLLFTLFLEGLVTCLLYQLRISSLGFGNFFGETEGLKDLGVSEGESGSIRSVGTFSHPSGAAMYLVLLIPLSLAFFLTARGRRYRFLHLSIAAVGIAGLIVTFSRAALVAFFGGMAVFLVLALRRRLIPRWLKPLLLFGCIGLAAASPLLYYYMSTRPEAFKYRIYLMETGWEMLKSNAILGVGLANSTAAKRDYLTERQYADDEKLAIHNHHLVILVETGVFGCFLFLGIVFSLGVDALRLSQSKDTYIAAVSLAILSSYTAIFIYGWGDNIAGNAHNTLMWVLAALIVVFKKMELNGIPLEQTNHSG